MNVIKKLGDYKQGDVVYFDVKAPATGTYTFEIECLGVITTSTHVFNDGNDFVYTNLLNEQSTVSIRVKYPAAIIDDGVNYVTSRNGEVIFQYNSVLSA